MGLRVFVGGLYELNELIVELELYYNTLLIRADLSKNFFYIRSIYYIHVIAALNA